MILFKPIIINYLYLIVYPSRHKFTSAHLHKEKVHSFAVNLFSWRYTSCALSVNSQARGEPIGRAPRSA